MDTMISTKIEKEIIVEESEAAIQQPVDMLARQAFVKNVIAIIETLSEKKSSCCFAIDGAWGSGKSFVLNMIQNQLGEYCSETSAGDKYLILPYNCLEYDYYEEPAVAIIASMKDSIEKQTKLISWEARTVGKAGIKKAKDIIFKMAGEFVKNKIGVDLVSIAQEFHDEAEKVDGAENRFDTMFSFKKTLDETRDGLKDLAKDQTILLVVDELDRCLPAYAIKVLERLHHLFFDIKNVIVMIAVDSSQLENSVKQLYGEKVNVDRYLRKFIDFTMTLDNGKVSGRFEDKYGEYFSCFAPLYKTMDDAIQSFNQFYNEFCSEMDIRTQEKLIKRAYIVHRLVSEDEKYDISLLLFEILWITFTYYLGHDNLGWLFELSARTFEGNKVLRDFIDLIDSRLKRIDIGSDLMFEIGSMVLVDNVLNILADVYGESIKTREILFVEGALEEKEDIIAKRFEKMIKLIYIK